MDSSSGIQFGHRIFRYIPVKSGYLIRMTIDKTDYPAIFPEKYNRDRYDFRSHLSLFVSHNKYSVAQILPVSIPQRRKASAPAEPA